VTDPRLMVLDEPTASIDARGQEEFFKLLQKLNETITILVVSHDFYAITPYLKSVACVNKRLHYHMQTPGTEDALDLAFRCTVEDACPVEMLRKKYKGIPIHDHHS
jgi:zinc transport system ATP-binding protein